MANARYDAVADFYDAGWSDAYDDSVSVALFEPRRQVGANHRRVSTYVNALSRHGLTISAPREPEAPVEWTGDRAQAARLPVFLVARCSRTRAITPLGLDDERRDEPGCGPLLA